MIRKLTLLGGLTLATAAAAQSSAWLAAGDGTQVASLVKAHQAYAHRDFLQMTTLVREVLADPNSGKVERQNALALVGKAFDENKGKLPADWSLPAPLTNLKFKHNRKELPDGVEYAYQLAVNGPEADSVTNIKLVKFPSEVILDREAGVGEWSTEPDEGGFYFEMYGGDGRDALPEGLYLFTITTKDGTKFDGWFPLENLTSSASPTLDSPAVGETFTQPNPELRWQDFKSPEYKPSERRILAIDVGRLDGPTNGWTGVWSHYEQDPARTSAVIGVTPDSEGVEYLADGKYWMSLTYFEQRKFGDLKLRRGSRTARPFYVNAAH